MNEYTTYLLKNTGDFISKEDYKGDRFAILSNDCMKPFLKNCLISILIVNIFIK